MPFDQDPGIREDSRYCSYCFQNGKFCYEGDFKGFQALCYTGMLQKGIHPLKAKFFAWMTRFAPRWKVK